MSENSVFKTMDADGRLPAGQPLAAGGNAEVLDLQGLRERCMGNLSLVRRVLSKFEQRLPEDLAELDRVVELGDAATIALVAHRIKGNSANVSAVGLRQAAAEIEDSSRAGQAADLAGRLRNLHQQWQCYADCRAAMVSEAGS